MLILDRFEGEKAIMEHTDDNGNIIMISIERNIVSEEVKEGDVLKYNDGIYSVDTEATEIRRKKIINRLRNHRKKNK